MRQAPLDRHFAEVSESDAGSIRSRYLFSHPPQISSGFFSFFLRVSSFLFHTQNYILCFIHSFHTVILYRLFFRETFFTMGLRSTYTSVLALASAAVAQNCPLAFDGRIPAGSTPALFDTEASPFGTGFVKGASQSTPPSSNPTY